MSGSAFARRAGTERLRRACGAVALLIGAAALAGWVFQAPRLLGLSPSWNVVRPNSALAIMLLGSALWLKPARLQRIAASGALLIAVLTLVHVVMGWSVGFDDLPLQRGLSRPPAWPGRTPATSAVAFAALGLAALLGPSRRRELRSAAELLGVMALMVAAATLIGYLLDTGLLVGAQGPLPAMALHTAVALVALSVGTVCAVPGGWLLARYASRGPGGDVVRTATLVLLLIPLLAWVFLLGEDFELYSTRVGNVLFAVATMVILSVTFLYGGSQLDAVDVRRQASDQRYRSLFEKVPIGLYVSTPDGRLLEANPTFVRLLGHSDRTGVLASHASLSYADVGDRERWAEMVASAGELTGFEVCMRRPDGTLVWCEEHSHAVRDETGRVLRYEGALIDITARRAAQQELAEAEERLRHAQKLQTIGRLAGGVAHDFNNLLTVILANAEMLATEAEDHPQCAELVSSIRHAGMSGRDIAKRLLQFSRRDHLSLRLVELDALVADLKDTLRRTLPESIDLRFEIATNLPAIRGDPAIIQQMLLNLVNNARDAMPAGGTLVLRVMQGTGADDYPETGEHLVGGPPVCLEVQDTGTGMSEEVRARLFEPFFTTKPPGIGTGLGLAMVYGSVRQHGGSVSVLSTPGLGTTIRLCFPTPLPKRRAADQG